MKRYAQLYEIARCHSRKGAWDNSLSAYDMTGKAYADITGGFDVEHNSKYLPSGGNTYCNIFAQNVADACDNPLPTVNCGTVQSIRTDGRYFTNPTRVVFDA